MTCLTGDLDIGRYINIPVLLGTLDTCFIRYINIPVFFLLFCLLTNPASLFFQHSFTTIDWLYIVNVYLSIGVLPETCESPL